MHPTWRTTLVTLAISVTVTLAAVPAAEARVPTPPAGPVVLTGTWVDPGPTLDDTKEHGTKVLVSMHGGTVAAGEFAGTSTYTLHVVFDPATNVSSGHSREVFEATLRDGRVGHVTISEHVEVAGDGAEVVTGRIVGGDGVFRRARGSARFVGSTDPSGPHPATGTYRMRLDLAG